jgi:hypothetical protein
MVMKTCNICGETKPLDEFSVLERGSWGVTLRVKHAVIINRRNITLRSEMKFSKSNVSGVSALAPIADIRMDLILSNTKSW